jgi:hypothetical protein
LAAEGETDATSSLIGRLTALVGLATGAVTIVYGAGAAVYWAALSNRDVPSNLAISTSLPREFLIGTGLLFVALPIALTVLLLFALTPIVVKAPEWGSRIFGGILTLGAFGLIWAVDPSSVFEVVGAIAGAVLTVGILTVLIALLVSERSVRLIDDSEERELRESELRESELRVRSEKDGLHTEAREELTDLEMARLERDASHGARRELSTYLAGVGLVAIMAWGILIGIARTDLPPAKLCTTDGGQYPGFLIGETGSRVYVGETASDKAIGGAPLPNQIISAPTADVAKLFIGSDRGPCKPPSPSEGTKPHMK